MGEVDIRIGQLRTQILDRLDRELKPLLDRPKSADGYDCCGCSTYFDIYEHALRIVETTTINTARFE